MENKRSQKISVLALVISILPLAAIIPNLLGMTLADGVRTIWAAGNILFVAAGLSLSIACVKNKNSRSAVNILATVISSFWVLLLGGMLALALFLNFMQP